MFNQDYNDALTFTEFELDKKLKRGEIKEEEMLDDFMELDYLESKRDGILGAIEKIR